ncbi:hypothetical protein [Oleiharenicola lentus]|uniref:hypothetical protein n=1 Tax=Oleiharenicola lentus TaxID=2508720 RepID=UPI003F677C3C
MKRALEKAQGALDVLDSRLQLAGQVGLKLWSGVTRQQIAEHRAELSTELNAARLDLFTGEHATRDELLAAITRAHTRLLTVLERVTLCLVLAAVLGCVLSPDDSGDLLRKASRERSSRRRENMVALLDAENGEEFFEAAEEQFT